MSSTALCRTSTSTHIHGEMFLPNLPNPHTYTSAKYSHGSDSESQLSLNTPAEIHVHYLHEMLQAMQDRLAASEVEIAHLQQIHEAVADAERCAS
ncbi:hypothetical protein FRC06_008555 [Ceratobasidium sp. 370]|nr:hypothetical protein FRC06_008555 [Ceratobasidium sp. 370]